MPALGQKNSVESKFSVGLLLPFIHLDLRPGFRASAEKSSCLQGSLTSRGPYTPSTFPCSQVS